MFHLVLLAEEAEQLHCWEIHDLVSILCCTALSANICEQSNNEKKDIGFDAMKIAIYSIQVLKTVRLKVSVCGFALFISF